MSQQEVRRISLVRQEIAVELEADNGETKKYILREMDGRTRDEYVNSLIKKMNVDSSGKATGFKTVDGVQSGLIARCLFDPATEKFVDEKTIQAFPQRVLTQLHEWAQELSGLDKMAEVAAKNV